MEWKSAVGLMIALFVISFVAPLFAPIGHKDKRSPTISPSFPPEMNNLSAEEINQRTLQLAATIKASTNYKIVSGGQTGVGRAALDIAIELGLEYGGWCPKEGWAEDLVSPPGLLSHYPKLQPTPLEKTEQRTEWNVRDSDATLILIRGSDVARSKGTEFTVAKAREHRRRHLILDLRDPDRQRKAMGWLEGLGAIHLLNVAGPRESEAPGIYEEGKIFVRQLLLRAQ